jgi:hypothetical protein
MLRDGQQVRVNGKDDDKTPDSISHSVESSIPFMPPGIGPDIHITEITKDNETTTGYGGTREEANKDAGDKYRRGERD